ncbi:MAG: hypothetical protein J6I72_07240 [Muribaculaceae bacterium]|nr:hypothetical protein [Muribaculaceae bacterium]
MKHLVYILLGLMLVGVACRRSTHDVEARLVAIDSLVSAQPDSALALLADINADSLPADLRAYHDVLTTQALYKAYIPATTDTLIARAWSYYRDHGPYDRRIRAMLYSGTTAEELGHPDSAMRWYKRTELESRPDDHYHRAYAQMSMGILYQQYMESRQAIDKYRQAIDVFYQTDTSSYLFCCQQLSQLYQNKNLAIDSSKFYIEIVKQIAKQQKDSLYQALALYSQACLLYYDSCFKEAKDIAISAISDFTNFTPHQCWYYASLCYAHTGQVDSAEYYFNAAPLVEFSVDSTYYFHALSLISSLKGNWRDAHKYEVLSDSITECKLLVCKESSKRIQEDAIEKEIVNKSADTKWIHLSLYAIIGIALVFVLTIIIIRIFIKRWRKNEKNLLLKVEWLEQNYKEHKANLHSLKLQQEESAQLLATYEETLEEKNQEIMTLRQMHSDTELVRVLYAQLSALFEKNFVPLEKMACDFFQHGQNASLFMKDFSNQFNQIWKSQNMWRQIERYINEKHNNCLIRFAQTHPNISDDQLHLIMLVKLGFSSMAIAVCMEYGSQEVVYAVKSRLKKKLGIKDSIEEYLLQLEKSNN